MPIRIVLVLNVKKNGTKTKMVPMIPGPRQTRASNHEGLDVSSTT